MGPSRQAPAALNDGSVRSTLRRAGLGAFRRAGRSPAALALLRALGVIRRAKTIPPAWLAAAAEAIVTGGRATTLRLPVTLPSGAQVRLECDLRFEGYRQLVFGSGDRLELGARLFKTLGRRAMIAVDVGASSGLFAFTVAEAVPDIRVLAFEPIPRLAELLRRNAEYNGWSRRFDVRAEVVGECPGRTRFFILESDTESTLSAQRASRQGVREEISVPVVALDHVLEQVGWAPGRTVIKIDVEGHEAAVLAGMARSLGAADPPEIIIEFLGESIQRGAIEAMVARGFAVYYLAPTRLVPARSAADFLPHQDLNCWNFYCTRRSSADVASFEREALSASS